MHPTQAPTIVSAPGFPVVPVILNRGKYRICGILSNLPHSLAHSGNNSGRSSLACAEVTRSVPEGEVQRQKNSKQEGRAFKMDEIVQRGCELCMLHCRTGGDSPGSSESCHRSNMPQTEFHTHTVGAGVESGDMSISIQFLNRMFAINSLYITWNLLNINGCL